jgi:hypothetical protein
MVNLLGGCSLLCEGPTITCTFVHKRQHTMKKKKKRNDEGQQVAAEKKRRKNRKEKKKKQGRESEAAVRRREREKNRVFLTATSIRDWGFVCGPILMKF